VPNEILNPSFEDAFGAPWTFTGTWLDIGPPFARTGLAFMYIRSFFFPGELGQPPTSVYEYAQQFFDCEVGAMLRPSIWVFPVEFGPGHLEMYIDATSGNGSAPLLAGSVDLSELDPAQHVLFTGDVFTVQDPNVLILLRAVYDGTGDDPFAVTLDDAGIQVEEVSHMAVMLGELAVKAVLAVLQASFNSELDAIALERNDGLVVPYLTSWYGFRRAAGSPDRTEIEVFVSNITFPRWATDLVNTQAGQRGPVVSNVEVLVGINFANRNNYSASQLSGEIGWRYASALVRCIRNQPRLNINNPSVMVNDIRLAGSILGGARLKLNPHSAGRVEARLLVSQNETHAGENTAAGGVPPSAIIEQV
jgi:hypothetical protein